MKDLIRDEELVISVRQERWLEENPNPVYSDEALKFAQDVLSSDVGGNRKRGNKFRSSAQGSCERRQIYKAENRDGINSIGAKLSNIFATGNFMHLKWQMQGLTEGWLLEVEVPAENDLYNFGGTLDGILYDNSLFEFKSINDRGYNQVYNYGPKKDHIRQANGYMWLKDLPSVSFVYENKATGDWREYRLDRDENIIMDIVTSLDTMQTHIEEHTLPEPLQTCIDKQGYVYRQCPYRKFCLEE